MTTIRARPDLLSCDLVASPEELACHHRIRRAVFVEEQRIFAKSDTDTRDGLPGVRHVLGRCGGVPAGTVRLYPAATTEHEAGIWQGDRLAVLPAFRDSGLGAPLVRFAVATAGRLGGRRMIAHIQLANEVFFTRLGWTRHGDPEPYVGQPHLLMSIGLSDSLYGAGGSGGTDRQASASARSSVSSSRRPAIGSSSAS